MTIDKQTLYFVFIAIVSLVIASITSNGANIVLSAMLIFAALYVVLYTNKTDKNKANKKECDEAEQIFDVLNSIDEDNNNNEIPEEISDSDAKEINNSSLNDSLVPASEMNNEDYTGGMIKAAHVDMGCSGDNQICNRMKYMAKQAQESQNIRAKWNARSLQPFVEAELREHANRTWWHQDHLDPEFLPFAQSKWTIPDPY